MGLVTYQSCTFREKRAVLRTFWTGHVDESDKVNRAAREYGPFALAMVAVITVEVVLISAILVARGSGWAWLAVAGSLLAMWSLWRTRVHHRATQAGAAGH
ncbi:MAG: hypothetical protein ACHQFZ_04505 [Acidimicrobiales bacterium]